MGLLKGWGVPCDVNCEGLLGRVEDAFVLWRCIREQVMEKIVVRWKHGFGKWSAFAANSVSMERVHGKGFLRNDGDWMKKCMSYEVGDVPFSIWTPHPHPLWISRFLQVNILIFNQFVQVNILIYSKFNPIPTDQHLIFNRFQQVNIWYSTESYRLAYMTFNRFITDIITDDDSYGVTVRCPIPTGKMFGKAHP